MQYSRSGSSGSGSGSGTVFATTSYGERGAPCSDAHAHRRARARAPRGVCVCLIAATMYGHVSFVSVSYNRCACVHVGKHCGRACKFFRKKKGGDVVAVFLATLSRVASAVVERYRAKRAPIEHSACALLVLPRPTRALILSLKFHFCLIFGGLSFARRHSARSPQSSSTHVVPGDTRLPLFYK